jgi:WD40 repeat protein
VWDVEHDKRLRVLRSDAIGRLDSVTTDGRHVLASSSSTGTFAMWDLEDGAPLATRALAGNLAQVKMAAALGGWRAVSLSASGALQLWNLEQKTPVRTLADGAGEQLALVPDGRRAVVYSSSRKLLTMWDLATGERQQTWEVADVTALAAMPDGHRIVTGSLEGALYLWDLHAAASQEPSRSPGTEVTALTVTPDGRHAISAEGKSLRVWNLQTGRHVHELRGRAVAVLPDGCRAVSASSDRELTIWDDVARGRELGTLRASQRDIDPLRVASPSFGEFKSLTVASDGRLALVWGVLWRYSMPAVAARIKRWASGRILVLWDLERGGQLRMTPTAGRIRRPSFLHGLVKTAAVTPDRRRVIAVTAAGRISRIRLWLFFSPLLIRPSRAGLRESLQLWEWDEHWGPEDSYGLEPPGRWITLATFKPNFRAAWKDQVTAVAVTPDSRRAVVASGATLTVWDLARRKPLHVLSGHHDTVNAMVVTPDGRHLVSASDDATLIVWDLQRRTILKRLDPHFGAITLLALTPDARRLLCVSRDRSLTLWQLEDTSQPLARFVADNQFTACALSPDGTTVVAGEMLGQVHILRLEAAS